MKKYKFFLLLFFLMGSFIVFPPLHGQFLSNPSFEGLPAISSPPDGWQAFDLISTPDTEPIACDDNFSAFDGNTYLTLVTRGSGATLANTNESCITELYTSLNKDACYQLSIYLAYRSDVGFYTRENGFTPYDMPVVLNIYGSRTLNEKGTLIYSSDPVTHTTWEKYSIRFKALNTFSFITLEADYPGSSTGNGNLAIDKFEINQDDNLDRIILDQAFAEEDFPVTLNASLGNSYSWSPSTYLSCNDCRSPEVSITDSSLFTCAIMDAMGCRANEIFIVKLLVENPEEPRPDPDPLPGDLFIPNVFTPNNDGINDYFEIEGIKPFSSIIVFDEDGKLVYQSENYSSNWDGTDINGNELDTGTYWYVLIEPGFAAKRKGYIYIKR